VFEAPPLVALFRDELPVLPVPDEEFESCRSDRLADELPVLPLPDEEFGFCWLDRLAEVDRPGLVGVSL
jgi:hypothetical protein